MKRILLFLFALGLFGSAAAQQGFKLGFHGSLPVSSETNNAVSLALGLDTGYLFALGEVVDLGAMAGFIHGFPEKFDVGGIDLPSVQFVPLAASARVWPSNSFSFGVDLGYALGLSEGNDGGLYYKPILGYLFGTQTEINLSYTGIETGDAPWSTVNFGILYTFPEDRFH
ncbi:hypothetical protein OZ410_00830 [Robiginitalea sp. M366]|uniref:hypothetical protein n=1 Tax=Robiginitalea aestuariiviva TaxID=3036903 RepID=UPI00240E1919|nr:hypothetical protein [Robiginitalea aestuariiviva]MDG1570842.1 hypothetical protein [Robiginitalea aestuariiviva]